MPKCVDSIPVYFFALFSGKEGLFSAIVEPAANHIINMFLETQEIFHSLEPEEQPALMHEYVTDGMYRMLDYVYDNFEEFQLLLDASYGTKFSNFIETKSIFPYTVYMKRLINHKKREKVPI